MLTKKLKLTAPKFQAHLSPGKVPYREDDRPGSRLQVGESNHVTDRNGEMLTRTGIVTGGEEKAAGDNSAAREEKGGAGQARLHPH
jgi:hypothetical protein